jgi:hypothetical protein
VIGADQPEGFPRLPVRDIGEGLVHVYRLNLFEQQPCKLEMEGALVAGRAHGRPAFTVYEDEDGKAVAIQVCLDDYVLFPRDAFERIGIDMHRLLDVCFANQELPDDDDAESGPTYEGEDGG